MESADLPFAPRALIVLRVAEHEAGRLRHREVGVVHLALALIRQEDAFAYTVFRLWQVPVDPLQHALESLAGPPEPEPLPLTLVFSEELVRFLAEADTVRKRLAHEQLGTDHMMLTLVSRVEHPTRDILARCGVTQETLLRVFVEQQTRGADLRMPEAPFVQALLREDASAVARSVVIRPPDVSVKTAAIESGFFDEDSFLKFLHSRLGLESVTEDVALSEDLLAAFPAELSMSLRVFPLRSSQQELVLATDDPFREELLRLAERLDVPVRWAVATGRVVDEVLGHLHPES